MSVLCRIDWAIVRLSEIFEVRSDGDAIGKPCDLDSLFGEEIGDIKGRRLPVEIRREGEDDFARAVFFRFLQRRRMPMLSGVLFRRGESVPSRTK